MRGARDLVEAREYARQVARARAPLATDDAETLVRFKELVDAAAARPRPRAEGGRRQPEGAPRSRSPAATPAPSSPRYWLHCPRRKHCAVSIRLYSTLSRRLEELPPPPGPIRMYVCGSTVYQRIHVGNSRPFVLSMWLRRWLRERGYDVHARPQHHRRQRQDLRGGAGGERASWPPRRRSGTSRTPIAARPRPARRRADGRPRRSRRSSARSSALIAGGFAYESEGDVYFRVARDPTTASSRAQRPDQVEEQEPNPRKEDPRDFALWKATEARRGHVVGLAVGARPAGLAHRVLGDGVEAPRAGVRDPRRRARPACFPHHENELAQSRRAGHEFARIWTAQRDARARRREDVEVARQRRHAAGRARALGAARRCCSSS